MTDNENSGAGRLPSHGGDAPEIDPARQAALAKQRFFALSLFRLSGAFILLFGMAISLGRFDWVQGDKAKWMGLIVSVVGFIQFVIIPRMLAAMFATPGNKKRGRT